MNIVKNLLKKKLHHVKNILKVSNTYDRNNVLVVNKFFLLIYKCRILNDL